MKVTDGTRNMVENRSKITQITPPRTRGADPNGERVTGTREWKTEEQKQGRGTVGERGTGGKTRWKGTK